MARKLLKKLNKNILSYTVEVVRICEITLQEAYKPKLQTCEIKQQWTNNSKHFLNTFSKIVATNTGATNTGAIALGITCVTDIRQYSTESLIFHKRQHLRIDRTTVAAAKNAFLQSLMFCFNDSESIVRQIQLVHKFLALFLHSLPLQLATFAYVQFPRKHYFQV